MLVTTPQPDPGPTADCLVRRLAQLRRFLRRWGFSDYVIERAIDRVIQAALPYLRGDGKTCPLRDRVSWLFGSALKAARQEAAREPDCGYLDPIILASTIATPANDPMNEAVWAALDQLTSAQQEAVYCCVMRGLTLIEAAVEMDCLPTTVLRHRDRGLQRLRCILSDMASTENTFVH